MSSKQRLIRYCDWILKDSDVIPTVNLTDYLILGNLLRQVGIAGEAKRLYQQVREILKAWPDE